MSADNGIYILRSPISETHTGEYEYRVTHAMAIENIEYKPDKEGFSTQVVKDYFSRCGILRDRAKALAEADRLAQECMVLEYGIQFIYMSFPFPD